MDGIKTSDGHETPAQGDKRIRRHWTTEIKRQIVREAEQPGAVRKQVAHRHGVNVSVVNRWHPPHAATPLRWTRIIGIGNNAPVTKEFMRHSES